MYGTKNVAYSDFPVKGEQPLHLNLWFKKSAKAAVQQLIKELEDYRWDDTELETDCVMALALAVCGATAGSGGVEFTEIELEYA